ncbi:MAG TPA: hypothetical protein VNM66_00795 [Thermodesulfobacteriota bacterium]|nr:hypothetical protein [Thermodesulfobacteriota bacterium]
MVAGPERGGRGLKGGPPRLGPREPEALASAGVGAFPVGRSDLVFADDDGVPFVPAANARDARSAASTVGEFERRQVEAIRAGGRRHGPLRSDADLARRAANPL